MWSRKLTLALVCLVGGFGLPPGAWASRCNQVSTVTDTNGGAATFSDLSDLPVRICSVEFTANGSNGIAVVYDSPDDSPSHAQAVVKSEPGAATSGNSEGRWYGEDGRPTQFGLDVMVINGTAVIQWTGAAP